MYSVYQSRIEFSLVLLTYVTHTIGNKRSFLSRVTKSGLSPGNGENGVSESPISKKKFFF